MSKNSFFTCDYCLKNTAEMFEMPEAWLMAGTWGIVNTNSIEAVWAVLKRGILGVYHSASAKHLDRYVQEFAFRLNEGNVKRHTIERLNSLVDAVAGKRITYKQVTA